jgi:phosphatidylserine decarboxylase
MDDVRWLDRLSRHERLNFLLTNRLPRRYATLFMGWFSRLENPLVRAASFAVWEAFGGDLALHEAAQSSFKSVHECFTRELKAGARPVDPGPSTVVSPCDAIVGAHGAIRGTEVFQAKGFPYTLEELLGDDRLVAKYRDGVYVTLRLKSNMYHRFHAPCDARVREVVYVSGDTWNVNPIALARVERLFCKNERALVELDLGRPAGLLLVPVAAILVASIRLNCLPTPLTLRYRGPNRLPCDARYAKGDEMGWFEHGSTILVFGTKHFALCDVREGRPIRMGRPLLRELEGTRAAMPHAAHT